MAAPKTVDELTELSWEDFEAFATNVLRRHYGSYRLDLIPTPFQHDGGRDAEATYIFGASPAKKERRSLAAFFKLWVEVKQIRTRDHLGLARIGKNLVRAVIEEVSKIVVVTNTEYTSGLKEDIEKFAHRVGIDYSLVTGRHLIELAEEFDATDIPEAHIDKSSHRATSSSRVIVDVDLRCYLSSDPLSSPEELPSSFSGPPGSPVFVIIDLTINHAPKPVVLSIEVVPKTTNLGEVFVYGKGRDSTEREAKVRDGGSSIPLTSGDRRRRTFVFFPPGTAPISIQDFHIRPVIQPRIGRLKHRTSTTGEYRIIAPILSNWIPPSRQKILKVLEHEIRDWLPSGKLHNRLLVATAGTGKSHAVAHLRQHWLSQGACEVYLDGGMQNTDLSIMERIFQQVFPVEPRTLAEDQSELIAKWLQTAGMHAHRALEVATAVCQRRQLDSLDIRCLGEIMASLLRRASCLTPVVLLFEDLHKCQPSALALLNEAYRHLRVGQAHVLLFATSREVSSAGTPEERRAWSNSFENLPEEFQVTEIHNPIKQEAVDLILNTIPILEPHYAEAVIEQVGRSPFGIREALHFLRISGVIHFDSHLNNWRVPRPELLYHMIESQDLTRSTQLRISRFLEKHPGWLRTFIEAGACLGRFFPLGPCLAVAGEEDGPAVRTVLGQCEEADLVRPSPVNPSDYIFDHDLIRTALLGNMEGRQRWTAGELWTLLKPGASPTLLGSLAYQAGYAKQSVEHMMAAACESADRFRHADTIRSLLVVLQVLDPDSPSGLSKPDTGRYLFLSMDEAIRTAPPPRLSDWPPSEIRRRVLSVLLMMTSALMEIGQVGSDLAARSISEAFILARSQHDAQALADLEVAAGCHKFALGHLEKSLEHHQRAEEIYAKLDLPALQARRVGNLVRLAISLRQIGQKENSLLILQRADATRHENDLGSAVKILQNCGALYFYSDLDRVREYWSSALLAAEKSGAPERITHCIVDMAMLDILDNSFPEARRRLDQALRVAEEFGLEESCVRTFLHSACMNIAEQDFHTARIHLIEAEKLAIRIRDLRDLWRIRANLATVYEAIGDLDRSYAQDAAAISDIRHLLAESPAAFAKLERLGREVLPFVNIALRRDNSPLHDRLFTELDSYSREVASTMADYAREDRLRDLPNLLWKHCKRVSGIMRFIITD